MIRVGVEQARPGPSPGPPGTPRSRRVPAASSSHSSSGLRTPPGNRQPIPTIAIGSPAAAGGRRRRPRRRGRDAEQLGAQELPRPAAGVG